MINTHTQWRIIAAFSLVATALCAAGFAWAIGGTLAPEPAPEEAAQSEEREEQAVTPLEQAPVIRMLALGDSLTRGIGDESGQGYVGRVADELKRRSGKPVELLGNLAVSGMTASELADRLEGQKSVQDAVKQANLIVFSIGGNDLFQAAWTRMHGLAAEELGIEELTQDWAAALEPFRRVTGKLHELNPQATVLYLGLYNPFYGIEELRDASLEMQGWNMEAYSQLHAYPSMLMVPTFDLFESGAVDYLSSDRFHPSGAGYEKIASRMLDAL
ncbi:GDSL-type esterase/lipase family protein [Paenibacillus sp. PL2-23]|uniref:GDSL-type esterase/lipase family protein n=1 Tax=Paenibacillus sp. PL2-23 TaxID=2100729 RepID=UPI0030FB301C